MLQSLPLFAGFLSYQHDLSQSFSFMGTTPGLLRSNINFSWIDIDNFDFQDDDAYNSTLYASANLIYFPTHNARIGIEYLWGQRKNKDSSEDTANQIQYSTRFTF